MAKKAFNREEAEEKAGVVLRAAAEIRDVYKRSSTVARRNGTLALKVDGVLERARLEYGDAFEENGVDMAILSQAAVAA